MGLDNLEAAATKTPSHSTNNFLWNLKWDLLHRPKNTSTNDADRLRKYLARFGIEWTQIANP